MSKKRKLNKGQTIYYHDEINDDFGEIGLDRPKLPKNYKYIKSRFWRLWSNFLYFFIAWPILCLFCFFKGIKIKNKKNIKPLYETGGFIYANHTAFIDAFVNQVYVVGASRRSYILGYTDALTIPVVNVLTELLGYIPIPNDETDLKSYSKFLKGLEYHINKKHLIVIFPEAHLWPYYTKIRPFRSASFHYPAKFNKPIIPITTIYRKGLFKNTKPKMTLVLGEPVYPKEELNIKENKEYLRNECYRQMVDISSSYVQPEYYHYVKKED